MGSLRILYIAVLAAFVQAQTYTLTGCHKHGQVEYVPLFVSAEREEMQD